MRRATAAQATAHRLVHCVLDGDAAGLSTALGTVVDQGDEQLRPYVRAVVAELIQVASTAVRDTAGRTGGEITFAVDLRDDDDTRVSIDELAPPARATVRALLADLNGSPADAAFQLDLAVIGLDPLTGIDTVRRALTMTVALLQWTGDET
ncbi:hypothetical protein BLA60_01315 [Actinophytocola xinjiangensis]|jgi:hypothetical protein|uniref:Uncharacterized protein n=1 Tax=Actinophytocola xinjiangensis TaxID=485602 RepID=A0A7Z1B0Q2_9PSEU|nr:hypothetical protein [Actinophytocola xinjiangensis]OLF13855.1 hypothetical protein BLA60_01315 [Actinophytocola xinjiangensis]